MRFAFDGMVIDAPPARNPGLDDFKYGLTQTVRQTLLWPR